MSFFQFYLLFDFVVLAERTLAAGSFLTQSILPHLNLRCQYLKSLNEYSCPGLKVAGAAR